MCDHGWFLSNTTCFKLFNISNLLKPQNVSINGTVSVGDTIDNTTNAELVKYFKVFIKRKLLNVYNLMKSFNTLSKINFAAQSIQDSRLDPLLNYLSIVKNEKQV